MLIVDSEENRLVHLGVNVIGDKATNTGLDLSPNARFRYLCSQFMT